MARFILDVASFGINNEEDIQEIQKKVTDLLSDRITTVYCIDETNDNQFYSDEDLENGKTNNLTIKQIERFSKNCDFKE